MPNFNARLDREEMMDDPNVSDKLLHHALTELPRLNRVLGGYRATTSALDAILRADNPSSLHILDVGTGIGDYPQEFVRWGRASGVEVSVVGIDVSESTVAFARDAIRGTEFESMISFEVGDARDIPFESNTFDVATAALFFHHLTTEDAIATLKEMSRVARRGVVVNDIHRCALAYYGIRLVTSIFPFSRMVRNDGPVSVLRAFKRDDLIDIGRTAQIDPVSLRWHWAFRWVLSNLEVT